MQNGTSLPNFAPISASSSNDKPNLSMRLIAFKSAAASALPPAKPPATGILL